MLSWWENDEPGVRQQTEREQDEPGPGQRANACPEISPLRLAPRTNSNKIANWSPRGNSREDSFGAASAKGTLNTGISPRTLSAGASCTAGGSPQATPRQTLLVAPLVDIKRELLGSAMRQLIREELQSVLSEKSFATFKSAGDEPSEVLAFGQSEAPPGRDSHTFLDDAEDVLCLRNARTGISEADVIAPNAWSAAQQNAIDLLDVSTDQQMNSLDLLLLKGQGYFDLLGEADPPKRTDPLSRVADNTIFSLVVHVVIVLNIVFMALEADYLVASITSPSDTADLVFRVAETIFVVFYAFEFVIQFGRYRWLYFYGRGFGWHWIDFLVLVFSIPVLFQIHGSGEALAGKIMRVLRLSRALRVLQLVTVFKKLNALLQSLTSSMSTLVCSVSMLVVFLFMFSLFLVMRTGQSLREHLEEEGGARHGDLLESFGSVQKGMLSLLKATTGGTDWGELLPVLQATGWTTQALFVAFIAFSQMALLNIILGMFVEQAMKSMQSDKLELSRRHFQEQNDFRMTTLNLLEVAGAEDGVITLDEWRKSTHKRRLYSFLDLNGFQPAEVDQFFELLANASPDKNVETHHFVNACIRMKGGASSFSVYEVLLAVSELEVKISKMQKKILKLLQSRSGGQRGPAPELNIGETS